MRMWDMLWITQFQAVVDERDLGIIMQNNLTVSKQCAKVVDTANRVLGIIYRTFAYKPRDIILPLYTSFARPHLEYCVQVWCLHLKKDIYLIDKVQRRSKIMIVELRYLPYEETLQSLRLISVITRRLRGDVKVFKILNGFDNIDQEHFLICSRYYFEGP